MAGVENEIGSLCRYMSSMKRDYCMRAFAFAALTLSRLSLIGVRLARTVRWLPRKGAGSRGWTESGEASGLGGGKKDMRLEVLGGVEKAAKEGWWWRRWMGWQGA